MIYSVQNGNLDRRIPLPPAALHSRKEARDMMKLDLFPEAIARFGDAIAETPPEHWSLAILYLDRAAAGIRLDGGQNGSFGDLMQARERIESIEGELREELVIAYNDLIGRIPGDTQHLRFAVPSRLEGTVEVVPEPATEAVEEVPQSRERALGHQALVPLPQPAEA